MCISNNSLLALHLLVIFYYLCMKSNSKIYNYEVLEDFWSNNGSMWLLYGYHNHSFYDY